MAAVLGGILAIIVLFVFLRDIRSTVIIGLSIPISIMATFALMYQTGITLNIMSLGGVALGVGMLVDNSIVVLESVHRHRSRGGRLGEAVYRGTREVGRAVTASTLTTVAVFVPLIFVEGIAGQLFQDQAMAITYSLLASLAVALTFIPMVLGLGTGSQDWREQELLASSGPVQRTIEDGHQHTLFEAAVQGGHSLARFLFVDVVQVVLVDGRRLARFCGERVLYLFSPVLNRFTSGFERLSRAYPKLLTWSLDNKAVVVLMTLACLALSLLAYRQLGAELIPPLAQGEFSFEIRLAEGRPLEQTDRVIHDLETRVAALDDVGGVFSSVGGSNKNQFSRQALEENIGQLYVIMKNRRDKPAEQRTIRSIREDLGRYPEVTYHFSRPTLFSFKTPIEVEIYAFDLADQQRVAQLVASRLQRINGLTDIQTSTELGNPEIQVRFDRQRLARLRLDETQIVDILRNKIRGDVASRFREGDKQIEILVRAEETARNTIADVKNLVINRADSNPRQSDGREGNLSVDGSRSPANSDDRDNDGRGEQRGQEIESDIPIRLEAVADVVIGQGPAEIRRIRSQRAAVVSANLMGRDLSGVSVEIGQALRELREDIPLNTVIGLAGQNVEMESSYRSLIFALGLAIFLVYLVMASQFESLIHPCIILFTVPLALTGVVLALFLTSTTVSVMVFLGVIILAGIVVNNAIVLIDYTNQLRKEGLSRRQLFWRPGKYDCDPL